jgi:hypothetical protein
VAPDWRVKSLAQAEYAAQYAPEAVAWREEVRLKGFSEQQAIKVKKLLKKYWTALERLEGLTGGAVTVIAGPSEDWQPEDAVQSKLFGDMRDAGDALSKAPKEAYAAVYEAAVAEWEKESAKERAGLEAFKDYANPFDPFTDDNWTGILNKELINTGKYPELDAAYAHGESLAVHDVQKHLQPRIALLDRFATESLIHGAFPEGRVPKGYTWDVINQVSQGYTQSMYNMSTSHNDYYAYAEELTGLLRRIGLDNVARDKVLGEVEVTGGYKDFQQGIYSMDRAYYDAANFLDRVADLKDLLKEGAPPGAKEEASNPYGSYPEEHEQELREAEFARVAAWEAKRKGIHDPVEAVSKIMRQYREQQSWITAFLRRHVSSPSQLEKVLVLEPVQEAFANIQKIACALEAYEQRFVQNWLLAEADAAGRLAEVAALESVAKAQREAEEKQWDIEQEKMLQEHLSERESKKFIPFVFTADTLDAFRERISPPSEKGKEDAEKLTPFLPAFAVLGGRRFIPPTIPERERSRIFTLAAHYTSTFKNTAHTSAQELPLNWLKDFEAGLTSHVAGESAPQGQSRFFRLGRKYGDMFDTIHMA